ncbi:MAG TPA: amidohydrolase [Cyclobacteriaceae bacterium]|nr:amidohydrolase [Cyclobacteriaceae bacterium]
MEDISRRSFLFKAGGIAAIPFLWEKPQLILYNGNFITIDKNMPRAQAVAIANDRLIAVGTNDEIKALGGPLTRSIDLEGRTVVPGFIDAHCHFASSGRRHLTDIDCGLDSIEKIKMAVKERAAKTPPGEWVYGFKYDDTKTKEGRYLTKKDLDEAAPHHPVIINHRGGHTNFVNSMAFAKAGVTEDVVDPPGGKFERVDGKLNGRLLENAADVFPDRPRPTTENFVEGVSLMSSMLAQSGITSAHDAGASTHDMKAYQDSYYRGDLKTRVYALIRDGWLDRMIEAGVKTGLGNEWVKVGPMKTAIDGSISERTARLSKPYVGSNNDYGLLTSTPEELYEVCKKAHTNGWQIGVHSNGDVGIDITLSVYERLQKEFPRKDPRFRLEHCTLINDDLVRRIKALGAIPCPFSTYVYWHGEKMKYYGEERLKNMFALRSFLDAGIMVTQTSDYPPGPYEPLMAIQSSVTRTDYTGKSWGVNQKVSVEEAITIGTLHGAYASYEENKKGSITTGKYADLVVLSKDPTKVDPGKIMELKIERTMAGGQWVYES